MNHLLLILFFTASFSIHSKKTFATLTPHLAELVFAAGASQHLVATSAYSDHPPQVESLPVIGDAFRINQELLLAMQPDYLLYWKNNTSNQVIEQIKQLNINVVPITTDRISDIVPAIKQIAELADTEITQDTKNFEQKLKELKTIPTEYKAFIQVSDNPIYTVNNEHYMSDALTICGLSNIFADLPIRSGAVDIEAVIAANPEYIIRFKALNQNDQLSQWKQIKAIKDNQIIVVNPDEFTRPTPRIIKAITTICSATNKPIN